MLLIQEDIHDLTNLSIKMCKSALQASKEEIRTYFKSQEYKSKALKEANEITDIQKENEIV